MKKVIFLLFVMSSTVPIIAQDHFTIGVKLGQNFSKVNNVVADKSSASYHVGVVTQFSITPHLGIAPEVILSQTKLEADPSIMDVIGSNNLQPSTYHLNYISFPVLLQIKPVSKFIIELGPQYSVLLNQSKDGQEIASMAFKSGEFAFVSGAKLNLGGFAAYGRYVVGMQDINAIQDQNKWKTRQWQLGISMTLFGL
jgi:hypothetical protein